MDMDDKLRRSRQFNDGEEIVSKLPDVVDPRSRIIKPSDEPLIDGVVDCRAPHGTVLYEDAIVCGDAAIEMSLMPPGSVSLAVTSPPYWNMVDYGYNGQIGQTSYEDYRKALVDVWKGIANALKPNGKLALNVPLLPIRKDVSEVHFGKTHTRYLVDLYADLKDDILRETDLLFYSLYIWEKQTTEKMFGSYPYPPNLYERNYIEFIAVFVKPGAPEKMPQEVKESAKLTQEEWMDLTKQIWWMYPENVKRVEGHPAPFPEALPNRLINMYTFPGDLVIDPFCGWGATCVAAKRLGRRYLGIDLSNAFCNEAQRRVSAITPSRVVMRASRRSSEGAGSPDGDPAS